MTAPSPMAAPSSMRAVGSIAVMIASVGQHRADIGFRDGRAPDLGVAMEPPHGLAAADGAHVIFDGVAGLYRLAKLALVDGQEIDRARLFGAFDRFDADHACGL